MKKNANCPNTCLWTLPGFSYIPTLLEKMYIWLLRFLLNLKTFLEYPQKGKNSMDTEGILTVSYNKKFWLLSSTHKWINQQRKQNKRFKLTNNLNVILFTKHIWVYFFYAKCCLIFSEGLEKPDRIALCVVARTNFNKIANETQTSTSQWWLGHKLLLVKT